MSMQSPLGSQFTCHISFFLYEDFYSKMLGLRLHSVNSPSSAFIFYTYYECEHNNVYIFLEYL